MMDKRVLVTGADGRLGNVLVRLLLSQGWNVRAGLHPDSKFSVSLEGVDVERIPLDITQPDMLEAAVKDCQYVIHLASVISMKSQDTALMEQVNVAGTRNLLNAARRAGVKRFVYAASCDSFVVPGPKATVDEQCALALNDHNVYNRTKAQALQLCLGFNSPEMTVLAVAPGGITGPNDFEPSLQTQDFIRALKSPVPVVAAANFDYVDVRDLSMTFMNALTRGRGAEVYLAGGHSISQQRAVEIMLKVTGKPARKVRTISPASLRAIFTTKAAVDRLLKRPDDGMLMSLSVLSNEPRFDSSKAARELGHQSRPIDETIADLGTFLHQRGMV